MDDQTPEQRLEALGIQLPQPPEPLGSYVPCVRTGNLLFVSGQLPLQGGEMIHPGHVGEEVTLGEGARCAQIAVINALAIARDTLGSLERVKRVVRLAGHVAAAPAFRGHGGVINGASDFLVAVFGERGRHARVALGAPSLPGNACVELEIIFETG